VTLLCSREDPTKSALVVRLDSREAFLTRRACCELKLGIEISLLGSLHEPTCRGQKILPLAGLGIAFRQCDLGLDVSCLGLLEQFVPAASERDARQGESQSESADTRPARIGCRPLEIGVISAWRGCRSGARSRLLASDSSLSHFQLQPHLDLILDRRDFLPRSTDAKTRIARHHTRTRSLRSPRFLIHFSDFERPTAALPTRAPRCIRLAPFCVSVNHDLPPKALPNENYRSRIRCKSLGLY
jgi:hypothetical protein